MSAPVTVDVDDAGLAVLTIDHQQAQVLQFDADHVEAQRVRAHTHHTRQHGQAVRAEHEFFGEVCDALHGVQEVLVVGSRTSLVDFKNYGEKHRPQCVKQIVGYEAVNQPTDGELVALARRWFHKFDRMAGTPTPV